MRVAIMVALGTALAGGALAVAVGAAQDEGEQECAALLKSLNESLTEAEARIEAQKAPSKPPTVGEATSRLKASSRNALGIVAAVREAKLGSHHHLSHQGQRETTEAWSKVDRRLLEAGPRVQRGEDPLGKLGEERQAAQAALDQLLRSCR